MGPTLGDAALITATFLFTDIEGSTGLWEREPQTMRVALQRHNGLLSAVIERHGGCVFKTVGDAFCVTFDDPASAVAAASAIQRSLALATWPTHAPLRVRIALHTGPAYLSGGDYFGTTLNRVARLLAVTHGGQTLLSSATEALVRDSLPPDCRLRDTGMLRLRDLPQPLHVHQLVHPGLPPELLHVREGTDSAKLTARPIAHFRPVDLYEVPTLPSVVVQALKVLQSPASDARAVERVIIHDPAISAKILRVANSAFFGFSRRVGTVAEAVRVLGFTNVQGMLISVAAFDAFRTEQLDLVEFWRHSIATATAARFLANQAHCSEDEAFMAGLLHDIGKLIFAVQAETAYRKLLELRRDLAIGSLEAERTLFDFTHAEVGQLIAERWDLPARYVAAIACHHDPAAGGEESRFCALIGLANSAAHATFDARSSAGTLTAAASPLFDRLGLSAGVLDNCLTQLGEARASIESFVSAIR